MQSVQRKIDFLRDSFAQLVASFPDDKSLLAIARQYDTWHYKVSNSILSKSFPSSIATEFEQWQLRYNQQYERLTGKNPDIETIAPSPDIITPKEETKTSPWIWAIIAGSTGLGLLSIAIIKGKK